MTIMCSCSIIGIMKLNYQSMMDFIIVNGWYPDFKKFCFGRSTISKKRLAYMFLVSINRIKVFKALGCNPVNLYKVVKVNVYEVS